MSLQANLTELEAQHQALDRQLTEAMSHPSTEDSIIVELKRRKLHVKDEIERLRHVH
jgi:hypothetical protein